ncbi:putative dehydrogenase [Friedmanniella endophytica]|uniref:Putative dehydrogenase n=1 Tax=Microlunatus kandeliicorticis TaxID=1759536 RepID=A0A7W3P6P4_9ACTN|nr:Gfo/Idh/MocA family oxidoreductase [Microlunatus kandeliicorticis]MBA8795178.1 putative dehydrogenase [Microlunatus kandeliicorticis]
MKIGVIGTGQFARSFISLWQLHPDVEEVWVTDLVPERAAEHVERHQLAGSFPDADALIASDVDAVAVMTQRWTHGELVLKALDAGKNVYSAVPMAITADEIAAIVAKVEETGLIYMMGETSYYNPAVVWARKQVAEGAFGRVFYSEGDYVHDMDNGFYAAYQFSGGEDWKKTASYPPMLYPTHAIGGVLGALPTHATSVSCIGIHDDRGDGVFDTEVSLWGNDFSNMSALFQLADGGAMRTNEFRRVGYWKGHESRFRFYGTEQVFEQTGQGATLAVKTEGEDYAKGEVLDVSDLFYTGGGQVPEGFGDIDPALMQSFASGTAKVQDRSRLPKEFEGAHNGHEGSHHFLADDFVRAVTTKTQPPVNAWRAARFTIPGVVAFESAKQGGKRLEIPDFGDGPADPGWDS